MICNDLSYLVKFKLILNHEMKQTVLLSYLACCVVSSIIGFNHVVLNNTSEVVTDKLNEQQNQTAHRSLNSERLLYCSSVGFWSLGALGSSFLAFQLVCSGPSRIGCKKTVYISALIASIGLTVQFSFGFVSFPWLLPVGRLVTGFGDGILLFTAEVYLDSVTPPSKEHFIRLTHWIRVRNLYA
ncbi:uncharacterized protein LOC134841650 [Symsagittifera roscoffensis]|uniref:uncharacterized protein LOC134841650 n=1 Tax=Symsagittifera roscoffensis TaxID=84072 RepID=UPI00307C1FED